MPTKNFFLFSLLTPTHSSCYPHSCPSTSMSLNCHSQNPSWNPATSTSLNCRLTQTTHDMPSGHVGHVGHLGHWMYSGMPSSPYIILGHPSHLGHLSHLGNIGDLDTLDPYCYQSCTLWTMYKSASELT
jgi:hypothetical protein